MDEELLRVANLISTKSFKEVRIMAENGELGDMSLLTYTAVKNILSKKDSARALQFLIEAVLGKPKVKMEHSGQVTTGGIDITKLSDAERNQLKLMLQKAKLNGDK